MSKTTPDPSRAEIAPRSHHYFLSCHNREARHNTPGSLEQPRQISQMSTLNKYQETRAAVCTKPRRAFAVSRPDDCIDHLISRHVA